MIQDLYPVPQRSDVKDIEGTEHELVRKITAIRWTFIIGKDRNIIFKNDLVNAEKYAEEVLNLIKLHAAE